MQPLSSRLAIALITGLLFGSAHSQHESPSSAPELGMWERLLETPWKEYGMDGAIQHVLFTRSAPDVITITVRTDAELRALVIVRLKSNRTARYCPVTKKKEMCTASLTFDERTITFTFDDTTRPVERAVLVTSSMFIHSREVAGVPVEHETYAGDLFDSSVDVRRAAYASMERYRNALQEAKRRSSSTIERPRQ